MTPAEQAERARLIGEMEEAGYERECAAARLRIAMDAAHDLQRIRDEDYAAWKRLRGSVRALAAFDAAHKGEG